MLRPGDTSRGGDFEIEISKFILGDMNKLTETIYHELLHTVKGCLNHGSKWKSLASKVNSIYGTNISRTAEATEKIREEVVRRAKYKITCLTCNKVIYRQRKSKLITSSGKYRCGICGGRLKVESI